jgi:hypothetical protein
MSYYLVSLVKNTKGQYSPTITRFDNLDSCKVQYHQKLASFINASDVERATVEILNDSGMPLPNYTENVIHEQAENE